MGAKSTIYITREDAIARIYAKLSCVTDETIEDVAENLEIMGPLRNFSIVSEYRKGDNWSNYREVE